jgi:hypothetical protein
MDISHTPELAAEESSRGREEKRREGERAAVNKEGSEQWRSTTKFSTVL